MKTFLYSIVAVLVGSSLAAPTSAQAEPQAAEAKTVLARIVAKRNETWRWQDVLGVQRTPFANSAAQSSSAAYRNWVLRLWTERAAEAKTRVQRRQALSKWVMRRGEAVSDEIHRSGGYRFDGWNDCYGFVKRTWNPILDWLRRHRIKGDYPGELPVGDYLSSSWRPITDWDELVPGDVLGTVQGHRGGPDVDYGMYAGKRGGEPFQFSNGGGDGPVIKPYSGRYRYYYVPTHLLLKGHARKGASS